MELRHPRITLFTAKVSKITAVQFDPKHMPGNMERYVPIIRSNCQKCGQDCNEHGILGKDVYCPGDYIVYFQETTFPMDAHTFRCLFQEDKT